MYGETADEHPQSCRHVGLSPHVRGNPERSFHARPDEGSIPACTGKPSRHSPLAIRPRVYPRMYGETENFHKHAHIPSGLSPHVRGNLCPTARRKLPRWSIPACTGKPEPARKLARLIPVYPRMYGETKGRVAREPCLYGLSPHVRGNLRRCGRPWQPVGSIPACTGKPWPPSL